MWNFIFYSLPWYVQIGLLLIPIAAGFYIAVLVFGWDRVRRWIIPALGILAALGIVSRAQQKGYSDRKTDEAVAQRKAERTVDDQRQTARTETDDQLKKDTDEWRKP